MESSLNNIYIMLKEMCDEDSPFNLDHKFVEEIKKLDVIKINNLDNKENNNNDNPIETKNLDD